MKKTAHFKIWDPLIFEALCCRVCYSSTRPTLVIIEPCLIDEQVLSHFTNLFSFSGGTHDSELIEETIPLVINDSINNALIMLPYRNEIK